MGLGLATVKCIVEKHDGRVWVETKEGEGSTFGFVLPKVSPDPSEG
jgi:signal transduction histidine kinase